jgi:hypothetical protein
MSNFNEMLTADRLREMLHYCPLTGVFHWRSDRKISRGTRSDRAGSIAGSPSRKGYLTIQIDRKIYKAHRLAWLHVYGRWPVEQIDHKNGVRKDNRLCNLREATPSQNGMNKKLQSHNTSGRRGVSFDARWQKWRARIQANGRPISLGYFKSKEDAAAAVCEAAKEYHGEFARRDTA